MMFPNTVRRSFRLPVLPRSGRGIPPHLLDHAAEALAGSINQMRQRAIADGVRPIPGAVVRSLAGYFPDALLRKCRYLVSGLGPLTLPVQDLTYGDATATTLIDVIIIRSDRAAQGDLKLWVRALTQVVLFQRWGLEEFTRRYVRDRATIERETADNVARFLTWSRDRNG